MDLNEIVKATKGLLPTLQTIKTRFRAYQLGNPGGCYSYFDQGTFTLIEARLNAVNGPNVRAEMAICAKKEIDVLHITSWDRDHCNLSELKEILAELKPKKIEYPGYKPTTDCGKACLKEILAHRDAKSERKAISVTPDYINGLSTAVSYGYRNLLIHPRSIYEKSNDNSTVKVFRSGCFNVLSLGDVESSDIAAAIKSLNMCREVDVLILPHHGADNGFLTSDLLDWINPKMAVCGADQANQYGHPAPAVRELLRKKGVQLATTIRGDVLIWSENGTSVVKWIDTKAGGDEIQKHESFEPKKFKKLNVSADNNRARKQGAPYRLI